MSAEQISYLQGFQNENEKAELKRRRRESKIRRELVMQGITDEDMVLEVIQQREEERRQNILFRGEAGTLGRLGAAFWGFPSVPLRDPPSCLHIGLERANHFRYGTEVIRRFHTISKTFLLQIPLANRGRTTNPAVRFPWWVAALRSSRVAWPPRSFTLPGRWTQGDWF